MRLGLVTCSRFGLRRPEDELLLEPLAELGIDPVPFARDAPYEPDLDAILIRSPWNYWHHAVEFMDWLSAQHARGRQIINSLPILKWNLTKSYLLALEDRRAQAEVAYSRSCHDSNHSLVSASSWADSINCRGMQQLGKWCIDFHLSAALV